MDSKLTSKQTCWAVMDVLTLGLTHNRLDDAEAVLLGLRAMRPRIAEFDTYEAWILMKRGFYKDAIRLLSTTSTSEHSGLQAKALLTYCQYVSGDGQWMDNAKEVIDNGGDEEASYLMKLLINPGEAVQAREAEESSKAMAADPSREAIAAAAAASYPGAFLRA
jgi:type III secretion protein HrpB1